jgi:predicted anti-sigma-YlaC factor YlaD
MDCKKVETFLLDHFYQELSSENREAIQSHLDSCNGCQTLYNRMSAVLSADLVKTDIHPNEFISTRIIAKIEKQHHSIPGVRLVQYFLRPIIVVSLVVLGIFTGIKISNTYSENSSNSYLANEGNSNLAAQYASENYLTSPNDEYLEMYLNEKK